MNRVLPWLVIGATVLGLACEEPLPGPFPNQPGGNPLVPEKAAYPFPSDFYLVADATTRTGRRVAIPKEALPGNVQPELFADEDGFSMLPAILAHLPGGFDASDLPHPEDAGATLEDDSPVFLIREGTFERVAVLAELDGNATRAEEQALILRPHRKLEPNTGYVVILRDLLGRKDGAPHEANAAFRALRDGTPTADPAVEQQREAFVLVNEAIDRQGLDPRSVLLAWSFHTRSEEQVTETLLEIQRVTHEQPVGDYVITSDATDGSGENRIIDGTFSAPHWLDEHGYVQLDADGHPILQGRYDVRFLLTIPVSVDEPRPVILYGHGFLGEIEQVTRGNINQLCRDYRFSAIATKLGFNSDDSTRIFTILAMETEKIPWVVSLNWQNMANFTAMARLVKERLAPEIVADRGAGEFNPLDPAAVHFSGISNGGTFGYVIASTSPAIERAAMLVGGGGLTHFLQRAVNWLDFAWLFEDIYPDPLDLQLVLSAMQGPIDPIDSINYVHRMVSNRFPGLGPMKAMAHLAVNDSQVRNVLTEWIARTADLRLVSPSAKDVWGLTPVDATGPEGATGIDGALYVYDEHVTPSPLDNTPPQEDNGTHGTSCRLPSAQAHWAEGIERGRFVDVCDGACDPN